MTVYGEELNYKCLSPDQPAPHVIQPCFSTINVCDRLVTPQTFSWCTGTRPHPWKEISGVHILSPYAGLSPHYQRVLLCSAWGRGGGDY